MSIRSIQVHASLTSLLLIAGLGRTAQALAGAGLAGPGRAALHASLAQTDARLLRNPDLHIELDSAGTGRVDSSPPASAAAIAGSSDVSTSTSTGPQVTNGGFEEGSTTQNYQYASSIPGWTKIGHGPMFIRSGSQAFSNIQASETNGSYLLGLYGEGDGVYQSVSGHVVGNWYKLIFHTAYRDGYEPAKLKVSVGASEKFNEVVPIQPLGWHEVTYQAAYMDNVITFEHAGPAGNAVVFVDGISVTPVEMWNTAQGGNSVLIQKVSCTGYPSPDTCTRGHFLAVGDYDQDGKTSIVEVNAATEAAVWVAANEVRDGVTTGRWTFKSSSLVQASPGDSDGGPARSGNMWYLHADYAACEARNWMSRATSTFDVQMTAMNLHAIASVGTECGSLFAIQKFANAQTTR